MELCIPAHNEAPIIRETLARTIAALEASGLTDWRIIVADNASSDGTADVARAYTDPRVSVLHIDTKGKGAALLAAAKQSSADIFGFIDADLSAAPSDVAALVAIVSGGAADIAIGSRLRDRTLVHRSWLRTIPSLCFNWLRRLILGINVHDSQCGLKIMNVAGRKVLASCKETGWFLDLEFLARAERAGLTIREVPVHWEEERFEGRRSKLLLRDSVGALVAMFRIRKSLPTNRA